MDLVIRSLTRIIKVEYSVTDGAVAKLATILAIAAKDMAERMVKEAAESLLVIGIEPSHCSWDSFLGYAARQQMQKLDMFGLLRRDKLILHHTARAKKLLKDDPLNTNAGDSLNQVFFLDVIAYMLLHFLPIYPLLETMSKSNAIEELPTDEYATPAPYSGEAIKCVAGLNTISYAAVRIRPIVLEPASIENILQEVTLTVDEAARIMRVAPKTLEDMCRDGRIPESVYTRFAKNGTYHFITNSFVAFVKNHNAHPKNGRR